MKRSLLLRTSAPRILIAAALVFCVLLATATGAQSAKSSLTASPTSQDLGTVPVGTQSAFAFVTLTNTGTSTLTVTDIRGRGVGNKVLSIIGEGTCGGLAAFGFQIVGGGSCTVAFSLIPQTVGLNEVGFSWKSTAGNSNWVSLAVTGI